MSAAEDITSAPDAPNRDAVVPVTTAARWLGGRRAQAAAWITAHVPTFPHPVTGHRSVVWGRVLEALAQLEDRARIAATLPARGTLPREKL